MASKRDVEKNRFVVSEKLDAVSRLTAGLAHQILNPVHILSMRFQLLKRRDDLPEDTKEVLAGCENQLGRITEIINGLRPFSNAQEGQGIPCDLNGTIEHALKLMAPHLKEKGINTALQCPPDLPPIPLVKNRIEQVFVNLISNAVDAMADQEPRLLGITTRRHTSEAYVQAVISDTGSGIDKADRAKVFDPYFTTKKSREHMGLGLFHSYNIVSHHGGRIWVESNNGGGSSFFVDLPTAGPAATENS